MSNIFFGGKNMKPSFKKIISIIPLFALSFGLGFSISDNSPKIENNNVVNVKRVISNEGIDTDNLTFDYELGILGGLEKNTEYHLVPKDCEEPISTNSFAFTSNDNGEISLLDDIGEIDPDEQDAKSIYGITIEKIYKNNEADLVKLNDYYSFPTHEFVIANIVGDGSNVGSGSGGFAKLKKVRDKVISEAADPSSGLTPAQQESFEKASEGLVKIRDNFIDWAPSLAIEEIDNIINTDFLKPATFINTQDQMKLKINAFNNGYDDAVISTIISEATKALETYDYKKDSISKLEKFYEDVETKVLTRQHICRVQDELTLKLARDVDTRSKPLQLQEKANTLKDEYFIKIENAKTIEEADTLYNEFNQKVNDLIVTSSWGEYCYIHWIYIFVMAFYGVYFIIRTWILKCKKLDVFNVIAVSIFGICSVVFTVFSACDLCTIMMISGWGLLILTMAIYGIYTIMGRKDPVLKTITDEDIAREKANRKVVSND